jgi:transposase-like protein
MTHSKEDNGKLGIYQAVKEMGGDGFKEMIGKVLQEVLEEEITAFLGAESYERTEGRGGYRNGYKPRKLNTRVGWMELLVPKDREGRFQTELFERYQRSEKALTLAIAEAYVQGVSTRKMKKITESLCGLEISKSQVSRMAESLDKEVEKWRKRPLVNEYRYLVVDARYEHIREGGEVKSQGVLLVVGISAKGYREILGVWNADSENENSWTEVFRELKERGLSGVQYIVSDDHSGLRAAIGRCFQGVIWQRCQVHFIRNVLSQTARKDRAFIMQKLHEITESSTRESALVHLREAVESLAKTHRKVSEYLDTYGEEILAVYALPEGHRKRMRSTNMLERYNQELKRRTRSIRIFPNTWSCIRLVASLAQEANEEWMEKRYLTIQEEETATAILGT